MELEEVCYLPTCDLLINLSPHVVNIYLDESRLEGNRPPPVQPRFWDSSVPLFSMYSKIAEEEDKNMAERWRKDADVVFIFVSPHSGIHSAAPISWITIDRFIFGRCRLVAYGDNSGLEAKHPSYFGVLSREHASTRCPNQRISRVCPF